MKYRIDKENAAIKKEIEIRGRYLMMACDIEYCLLNIIMFCNPDPNNHERAGQFKGMKMAAKINNVISDIKKYKPTYYLEFKKDFDGLEEFRRIRNDMSHCKGDFVNEPDDLSEFRVTYVDKDESGKEGMKFTIYSEQFIEQSLDRLATINGNLSALWLRLSKEYNSDSNPFVYRGFEA